MLAHMRVGHLPGHKQGIARKAPRHTAALGNSDNRHRRSTVTYATNVANRLAVEVLSLAAGTDRGHLASTTQRTDMAVILKQLEDTGLAELQTMDSVAVEAALNGKWQLVYSSCTEVFRSSPFFWVFQEGLVGNLEIASQIFKFTDGIPGAEVGQAFQTFVFPAGQLISEVDLEVFPGAKGTVMTTADVTVGSPATSILVTVHSTQVVGSNILPQLFDQVTVPVQSVVEGIRGPGATRVALELRYIDDTLRVMRTPFDDHIFVYKKV